MPMLDKRATDTSSSLVVTTPAAALTTVYTFCGRPDFWHTNGPTAPTWSRPASLGYDPCVPPAWNVYWSQGAGYYSPGICPSGYTSCASRWDERQGPPLRDGETAIICAASGYTCHTAPATGTITDKPTWTSISVATSTSSGTEVYNPLIQVRWQAGDLCALETNPTEPGARPSNPCTLVGEPGVNKGAIGGIAVGVAISLMALVATAFFLARRHRNKKLSRSESSQGRGAPPGSSPAAAAAGAAPGGMAGSRSAQRAAARRARRLRAAGDAETELDPPPPYEPPLPSVPRADPSVAESSGRRSDGMEDVELDELRLEQARLEDRQADLQRRISALVQKNSAPAAGCSPG